MKKSITSVALLASAASAFAFIGSHQAPSASRQAVGDLVPGGNLETKTRYYCLNVFEDQDGSKVLGSCDESFNNQRFALDLSEQGCTASQAALRVTKNIQINACPAYAQL